MKRGDVVFQNSKGRAEFEWYKDNGEPMYRIYYSKGGELWTNSMEIIEKQLKETK